MSTWNATPPESTPGTTMTVVEYSVTVGDKLTPEQASEGLFPGCRVVWTGEERHDDRVTYFYLVEWTPETQRSFHP